MDESKRQLWEERFEEQSNSNMTIDAWCSQNQISKHMTRGRFVCHIN